MGKSIFYSFLVLFWQINATAANTSTNPGTALIVYEGYPSEVEVVVKKSLFSVREQAESPNEPLELVQLAGCTAVVQFRKDVWGEGDPRYVSSFVQLSDNEYFDVGKYSVETLRQVFARFQKPGAEVSVKVSPELWAPGRIQSLVVEATDNNNPFLELMVETYQSSQGDKADWVVSDVKVLEIPLEKVGDQILPMSSQFELLPARPEEQNFFLQRDFQQPVPVVVLGFADKDHDNIAYSGSRYAYVVSRQALEKRNAQIEIYHIPAGMLRYTHQAEADRLRGDYRKVSQPAPAWLETYNIKFSTNYEAKPRSFTEAFKYYRKIAERYLQHQGRPALQPMAECKEMIAWKRR